MRQQMQAAMQSLAHPNAAADIAGRLLALAAGAEVSPDTPSDPDVRLWTG